MQFVYLFLATFLACATEISAQKIGFVRTDAILAELSDYQSIDIRVSAFRSSYQAKLDSMNTALLNSYENAAYVFNNVCSANPGYYEKVAAAVEALQAEVTAFEQKMLTHCKNKKKQLQQEVLDRVNQAIKEVAIEGNYQYILDRRNQIIFYADNQQDLTELVLAKLEIVVWKYRYK